MAVDRAMHLVIEPMTSSGLVFNAEHIPLGMSENIEKNTANHY
jgi:hypothetical protein